MEEIVEILKTDFVTHDVRRFVVEKPDNFKFIPGQATEVSINKPKWEEEKRPFTFTSLPEDQVLEFTIKGYYDHDGVTNQLHQLKVGDELILRDPFGTINYQGEGVFIAGGAGITPFIAILRSLYRQNKLPGNKLIFSNKTSQDVILEQELRGIFDPEDLVLTLTQEENPCFKHGRVDKKFIKKEVNNFNQNFYLCGPPAMVKDLKEILGELGAEIDEIVFEGKKQ